MKVQVYSLRDSAAECFGRPIFVPAIGLLVRELTQEVNRVAPDNNLCMHSSSFDLFHLGSFDDHDCRFDLLDHPNLVMNLASLRFKGESPVASEASGAPAANEVPQFLLKQESSE